MVASERIDVLAVMDAAEETIGKMGDIGRSRATKIGESRAAVAELIEQNKRMRCTLHVIATSTFCAGQDMGEACESLQLKAADELARVQGEGA